MNLLFMTLLDFDNIDERNIYTDLLREFYRMGHTVYAISPVERKKNTDTYYVQFDDRLGILKLKIGNVQKTNVIEKGISTLTLERRFITAIRKYFSNVKFDLILYSTPPITFQKAVAYVKKRDNSIAYLMLKDIFPQNAVDMRMLSETGAGKYIYKYFRKKEKKLYEVSDYIGCMSEANVQYVKNHNEAALADKVEVCPNCIEPSLEKTILNEEEKAQIRQRYEIPQNKTVFVYGGNLGRPQGIDFVIACIKKIEQLDNIFVLIVGSGTEFDKLNRAIDDNFLKNTKLVAYIPQREYNKLLQVCHVGLIFLDYRFTIPNFPSRLLAYMDAQMPVLAIIDEATDVGEIIKKGDFGWACKSRDSTKAMQMFDHIAKCGEINAKGKNAKGYLKKYFNVEIAYNVIASHLSVKK